MRPSAEEVMPRLAAKNAVTRPMIVPAIPLPLMKKQQLQKQQRQKQQQLQQEQLRRRQEQEQQELAEQKQAAEVKPLLPEQKPEQKEEDSSASSAAPSVLSSAEAVRNGANSLSPPTPKASTPSSVKGPDNEAPVQNGNSVPLTDDDANRPDVRLIAHHQAHPSNGSMTFGSFHGPDGSSPPPPPQTHNMMPPPGLIGGPPPVFVAFSPPGPDMGDWHGPPRMVMANDMNRYGTAAGFIPSTPASFHSSQSPDNINGGSGANGSHSSHASNGGPFPPPGMAPHNEVYPALLSPPLPSPFGFPDSGGPASGDMHPREVIHPLGPEFVHFLERRLHQNFHDPRSSDCYVFLHFPVKTDLDTTQPVMFMGHRAALAQSYPISHMLHSGSNATVQTGSFGYPVVVLRIDIEDSFISPSASLQALRTLYGYGIDDISATAAQSRAHAMDVALANMAAGFLFMLDKVEKAGMEQACQLLGWDTVEHVLAFCLNGVLLPNTPTVDYDMFGMPYPQAKFRYARGSGYTIKQLLHKAFDFLVWNVPVRFTLQKSIEVADNGVMSLSRFPKTFVASGQDVAHGVMQSNDQEIHQHLSSGSVSLPSRTAESQSKRVAQQPAKIVFGDFSPAQGHEAVPASPASSATAVNGTNKARSQLVSGANSVNAILSRVLVNLPFGFANYILEHPDLGRGGSSQGMSLTLGARRAISQDLAAEREHQRLQALREIAKDASVDRDAILARLHSPAPALLQDYIGAWDGLGWKESCHQERPGLVRVWAQLVAV